MISGFQKTRDLFHYEIWIAAGFSIPSLELITFLGRDSDHLLRYDHVSWISSVKSYNPEPIKSRPAAPPHLCWSTTRNLLAGFS